jgi:hypothetical protein
MAREAQKDAQQMLKFVLIYSGKQRSMPAWNASLSDTDAQQWT